MFSTLPTIVINVVFSSDFQTLNGIIVKRPNLTIYFINVLNQFNIPFKRLKVEIVGK